MHLLFRSHLHDPSFGLQRGSLHHDNAPNVKPVHAQKVDHKKEAFRVEIQMD